MKDPAKTLHSWANRVHHSFSTMLDRNLGHLEYAVERGARQRREPDHGEMTEQARGHGISPAPRWSARRDKHHVLDSLKEQLLGVVEATRVNGLSKWAVVPGQVGGYDFVRSALC